jgi:CheY-like chemotaxis protein
LRKASSETSSIAIATVSALTMPGDERGIRESGCDAYVAKPVHIEQLLKLAAGLLGGGVSSSHSQNGRAAVRSGSAALPWKVIAQR